MDTSIILQAILGAIAEKGVDVLGRGLARATRRLWKRAHAANPLIPSDPAATSTEQGDEVARTLDELASSDPAFRRELDEWKGEAKRRAPGLGTDIRATNRFAGLAINSSVTQTNQIGPRK